MPLVPPPRYVGRRHAFQFLVPRHTRHTVSRGIPEPTDSIHSEWEVGSLNRAQQTHVHYRPPVTAPIYYSMDEAVLVVVSTLGTPRQLPLASSALGQRSSSAMFFIVAPCFV
ncbi:hypothetical protein FA13DRAFT_1731629 [Coprinellus micaceus]|uniref:Uncharacterized protein n=1 Tax=Coprinellus micaceus TaxID=71717 RepID=A0A4Y7TE33_COPMI|nr:hypothetical protein FA13DRAFT_1731629 [Coprinellus micaceus]